jgi:Enoyl-(Acyl carrier protein) reductase
VVKSLGFRLEGFSSRYLKIAGRWRDHERWAILREQFLKSRRSDRCWKQVWRTTAVARGIAESLAGTGVTANSILAGPTESEGVGGFVEAMAKQQEKSKAAVEKEFFPHVRPSSLLKRFATVDEVAAMAAYLAGEPSSATNGAALRVDGGVVRAIL